MAIAEGGLEFDDGAIMLVADAAPFSTRDVWEGYLEGFAEVGVNVLPYPTFSILELLSSNLLGSDLIGKAMDIRNGVSAVVFISGIYFRDSRSWVVQSLTQRGMPTVLIATDDPYEEIEAEGCYSIRFSNEISCAKDDSRYLPTATVLPHADDSAPWVRDLVFVGTVFEDRWDLIRQVAMYCELNEHRFDIFGHFPAPPEGLEDMEYVRVFPGTVHSAQKWSIYSQSKLVLNVFRSPGDKQALSASPRVYEVAGMAKPALITNRRQECTDLFGDSIYTFDGIEEFGELLEEALASDDERDEKVSLAREIVLRSHLYQHRVAKLMRELKRGLSEP